MLHAKRPVNFSPRFEVVSCFVLCEDRFLLLHRGADVKLEAGKWGLPAGKKEKKELEMDAMLREILEETGIKVQRPKLQQHHTMYVRYPDYDFTYYTFHTKFVEEPEVTLNPAEHSEYRWVTPKEALKMNLVRDLGDGIEIFFKDQG